MRQELEFGSQRTREGTIEYRIGSPRNAPETEIQILLSNCICQNETHDYLRLWNTNGSPNTGQTTGSSANWQKK